MKLIYSAYQIVSNRVWYHGRQSHSLEFKEEFAGKGNDEQGPGFYFSSDYDDAAGYAYPNGIVINARLDIRKKTPKKPKAADIKFLMKNAPDFLDTLTNWDEDPRKAFQQAFKVTMGVEDAYQQVWIDFYRYHPAEYLKNMVKLGYDGREVQKANGVTHMIVYNPKAINIIGS